MDNSLKNVCGLKVSSDSGLMHCWTSKTKLKVMRTYIKKNIIGNLKEKFNIECVIQNITSGGISTKKPP